MPVWLIPAYAANNAAAQSLVLDVVAASSSPAAGILPGSTPKTGPPWSIRVSPPTSTTGICTSSHNDPTTWYPGGTGASFAGCPGSGLADAAAGGAVFASVGRPSDTFACTATMTDAAFTVVTRDGITSSGAIHPDPVNANWDGLPAATTAAFIAVRPADGAAGL